MPAALIEKYERILQTDPRSRIFVELARALLEGGRPDRAAEVCERGLQHHPDSVQALLVWGKALLALGRGVEALAHFDEAVAQDGHSAYACDVAGEALMQHGLVEAAALRLARAAELHPGDARVRRRLEEARRAGATALAATPPPSTSAPSEGPELAGTGAPEADAEDAGAVPEDRRLGSDGLPDATRPVGVEVSARAEEAAGPPSRSATPETPTEPSPPVLARTTAGPDAGSSAPPSETATRDDASPRPAPETPPPLPPGGLRRSAARPPALDLAGVPADAPPSAEPAAPDAAARAAAEAQRYEQALRADLTAKAVPAARSRSNLALVLVLLVAVPLVVWSATRLVAHAPRRTPDPAAAVSGARNGLARDTLASLREAARALEGAASPEANLVAAQVAAVLAHDFDDAAAGDRARELLAGGAAGAASPAVRWLTAPTDPEREAAAGAVLAANPDAPALVRAVAGDILLARRELDAAVPHLEAAARASPPLLRAVAALGDVELARGDAGAARDRYALALRAQPDHPRAAIGDAEAALQLGAELPRALQAVEALDRDAAAVPGPLRLRLDLAVARLLDATGRTEAGASRLALAAQRAPGRPEVPAARAELLARAGDPDGAIAAAREAIRLAPDDATYRERLAALQLRTGREADLAATRDPHPTRTLLTYRGIARLRLGDVDGALADLEATRRDGKMTPEAAAWMAVAELAAGRTAAATAITTALLAAPSPHPVALVARGRLDLAAGDAAAAERRFREALARDPELALAQGDLGKLLAASPPRALEARELLQRAAARQPSDAELRRALGEARFAAGDAPGAVKDLEAAAAARPRDAPLLVALASARLAAGDARGAWRAAERALAIDVRNVPALLAAGRAARAQGDAPVARRLFARAARLGGDAPAGREARAALAEASR